MATSVRSALLAIPISLSIASLVPTPASAERDRGGGGGGGGGGRLGQVSAGLGAATGGDRAPSYNPPPSPYPAQDARRDDYEPGEPWMYRTEPGIVVGDGGAPGVATPPSRPVKVDFFAGAQKVHESDGSLSLELAFNEGRFRLGGSVTRYFERQEGADALTFTLGSVYLGLRIDDGGPTRAYLEAGLVVGRTRNDPMMDSSLGGALGGVRVEHQLSRRTALVGDAQVMAFEADVRATAARAGVRFGHLQATLRYLDLNVGPALFGPEVGIRF
ncbi:MAG TPA: hypothetical protein VNO30_01040 [Kofleriaceae bacterium]|nr:hypothetical protein [Kofleriaceae bacterium]